MSITLLACEMSAIVQYFEHSLAVVRWLEVKCGLVDHDAPGLLHCQPHARFGCRVHIWSDREGSRSPGKWAGSQPSAASDPGEGRGQDEGVVVPLGTRGDDAVLLGTRLMIRGRMLQGTALRKHPFSSKAQDHPRQGSAEAFYLQKASYNSKTKLPNMRHCRHLQSSPDWLRRLLFICSK